MPRVGDVRRRQKAIFPREAFARAAAAACKNDDGPAKFTTRRPLRTGGRRALVTKFGFARRAANAPWHAYCIFPGDGSAPARK